ncbi:histidine phosphotransferase ChpT [Limimonas halophila]|uniref:Histidine phosphotransferase ChpT n=1 Tax=Limimonas halophila TaxID=1082479 RepID=A0A1G7M2M0_9PROT|nr:histidine phosphotransferase family protein [Limimonas halophila]SDF55874.1 histidine phosphotransferase ChpT [Limimonas halophila]
MSVPIDLRVAELLASRLCHDLVGPVGAVNNGMELLADDPDGDDMADAVSLAQTSARRAADVLQFYRAAYGRAGDEMDGQPGRVADVGEPFATLHKCRAEWDLQGLRRAPVAGSAKLVLNMLALGVELLPRGGRVTAAAEPGETLVVRVTARGQGAALRGEARAALDTDADPASLSPRAVHAHFTAVLAHRAGGRLTVDEGVDEIGLAAALPAAGVTPID